MNVFCDALSRKPTVSIGTQALILGAMQIVERRFPDAGFVLLSEAPHVDSAFLSRSPFRCEVVRRPPSQLGTIRQIRRILGRVNAVVSPWGDGYITFPPHMILRKTLFLKKRGVPLVLFTSSIGPFTPGLKSLVARLGLQRFDALTVRDTLTYEFMMRLGLDHARLVPDTAFVLEACPARRANVILRAEGIPDSTPYIGLNPSVLLYHRFAKAGRDYPSEMAAFAVWMRDRFSRPVVLLPHQVYPDCYVEATTEMRRGPGGDDRYAMDRLLGALEDREGIYPVSGEYTAGEIKGLIARSEMFVGGRMHSVIAAVSSGVPAVIMEYSHKAPGVMKMIGLEDYVWDIGQPAERLRALCVQSWNRREELSRNLTEIMPGVRERAYGAADDLARLCV